MKMYRAIPKEKFIPSIQYTRQKTQRVPSNIPYLIDNIWEVLRPQNMPSRRFSVYASPSVNLALANASAVTLDGYIVTEVVFNNDNYKLAHISESDARYHKDIKKLTTIIMSFLGKDFSNLSIFEKLKHSVLFLPSSSREELLTYFNQSSDLKNLLQQLNNESFFWKETSTMPQEHNGELFFELLGNCSYSLKMI